MNKPKRHIRLGPLLIGFILAKMKFLHGLLPDRILYSLPSGWSFKMLRTFLGSGRKRVYTDVCCHLESPESYEPKAEVSDEKYRLSADEIKGFYDNGYLGPFPMYSPEEMAECREEVMGLFDDTSGIYPPGSYRYTGADDENVSGSEMSNKEMATKGINVRDRHLENASVLEMYMNSAITDRISQILGPDLLLWRTQLFPKQPGDGGTAWHQASVYLLDTMRVPTLDPPDINQLFQITVWIAVTDSTLENGCLQIIPGTNREICPIRVEEYDREKHAGEKHSRFGTKVLDIHYPVESSKVVDVPMKAGEFLIFSERTIHGSLPNITTDDTRLGVTGRYIIPEVRCYNPWTLGEGGLDFTVLRLKGMNMDRWRAVCVKGEDKSGVNGDRVVKGDELLEQLRKETVAGA